MNCDEIRKKLIDYPDGVIDSNERQTIENHLAVCPTCREEQEALAKAHAEICRCASASH